MPWCPIKKFYTAGEISIIPFGRDEGAMNFDALITNQIKTILSSYKNIEGHPIERAALIKYGDKPILSDLTEEEIDITSEYLDLICFSGLANREFFRSGNYCNTDCFIRYIQNFNKDLDFIGITSRRREGRTMDGRDLSETVFSIPVHSSTIGEIEFAEPLLLSLINFRKDSTRKEWGQWQNAILCFNLANTDSDAFRHQVEWIFLCSAFEQLLSADSNAKDVVTKFSENFIPNKPLKVRNAKRKSQRWKNPERDIRSEWMREFYRVRGDFAHGKLNTGQQPSWNPLENLVLASISFPLLVKVLLAKKEFYKFTEEDQIMINIFESLADKYFLNPIPDRRTREFWIDLLIREEWSKVRKQGMLRTLKTMRANEK
jgi:hypothetical protein